MKPILGLLVLALALWGATFLFGESDGGPTLPAPAVSHSSSHNCAECHAQVFEEWSSGPHADSWTGAAVRKLSGDFSNQDCIDCHAPQPVFVTGIAERVLPRIERRVEGVDCITCHALPDGGVAGSFTSETVACRPEATVALTRADFCAGCHDQHQTVQQWRDSRWAAEGIDCIDCHMPLRDGTPSGGRRHGMHGGTDLVMLQSAVEVRGSRVDDDPANGWLIEIENVGAGHSFPTDERSRAADLFWRPAGSEGAWTHLHRFRSPYRYETDVPDTLLPVHATERYAVLDADDAPVTGPIEVVLLYKRSPHYRDMTDPMQDLWPEDPGVDPYATDVPRDAIVVHRLVLGGDQ
ncbi:hypothetical protein Pla163_22760 [Planctomycetes bacterium Pla163]|uniref:Cytochrome c-552/4 domain-containing protein n=1 Tax=Rohdeia mirabilis TaxID=2528008 RepID=A0A518D111_9BACT|nr:hypothetical protein Pla163_22760 [Planctomycetes bacterium Pla163]